MGQTFFIEGPKDNVGKWTVILTVNFCCETLLLCSNSVGHQKQNILIETSDCE
jgi:hypothetical protein